MTVDDHPLPTPMRGRPQPERARITNHERLRIVDHPLALTLLARLRDQRTGSFEFGAVAGELARLLLWEASHDVELRASRAPNFSGELIEVQRLAERVAGVAILRAGLVFAGPFRALFPDAPLHQLGVRRDEASLRADVYTNNLPAAPGWAERVLLLDPMLATGGSACVAIDRVRRAHAGRIDVLALLAAPLGVERVLEHDTSCRVFTTALDERLDERGYIVPGLGDAGDRLFGTAHD
jgi:uracil phosphoribosyltransferase